MNLLRTTEAAAIGIHAAALMAAGGDATYSVSRIAERLGVSENHCSKVMQRLHRSGLLNAVRGPHGGYTLARSPGEVTLAEVIEAIEGESRHSSCLFHTSACRFGECVFGGVLHDACEHLREYFENTTLAAVAGKMPLDDEAE